MSFQKIILFGFLSSFIFSTAQENDTIAKKDYGRVYGGFESNAQWYLNDKGMGTVHPEDPIRSNNYLFVNYQIDKWTAGVQVEGYLNQALLNYNPNYEGVNLGTYFLNYKTNKIDVTAGHFYEQFGSGLLLRAWEARSLGINTAIFGGRVVYKPSGAVKLTALYGQQRSGFKLSDGKIFGFDSDIQLSEAFKLEKSDLSIGMSYVGRYEKIDLPNPDFDELTNSFSARMNYSYDAFYSYIEYNFKSKEAVLNRISTTLQNDFVRPGNALLFNLGYSKQGLGIDATFRRTENMSFLSERVPTIYGENTSLNFNDKVLNFTPALTKQHHSLLANIYVYQAQVGIDFKSPTILKSGETGGQIDVFYEFEKNTALGGKYGTKFSFNAASWYNLPGDYQLAPNNYTTRFLGVGTKYYSDYNIDIKKKLSEKWHSGFIYINQYYNKPWIEDGSSAVNTNIVSGELVYNIKETKSIRFEGEHMWADADQKNWLGGTLEIDLNNTYSFYVLDVFNYGNDNPDKRNHYYTSEGELQTLPNIDINIKCGNSLVSRFGLKDSLKSVFKNKEIEYSIEDYKIAVNEYKQTNSKSKKREVSDIIKTVKSNFKTNLDSKIKDKVSKASGDYENEKQRLDNLELFGEKTKKTETDNLKKLKLKNYLKTMFRSPSRSPFRLISRTAATSFYRCFSTFLI